MCEICRQYPCHPMCPNARVEKKPPEYFDCDFCGDKFQEGYKVPYQGHTVKLCDDCMKEWETDFHFSLKED